MDKRQQKQPHRPQRPASTLPPIPRDTIAGARLHGIADAIRAVDRQKGEFFTLQAADLVQMAATLDVPVLFLAQVEGVGSGGPLITDETVEQYRAWRHQLAGKAVQ